MSNANSPHKHGATFARADSTTPPTKLRRQIPTEDGGGATTPPRGGTSPSRAPLRSRVNSGTASDTGPRGLLSALGLAVSSRSDGGRHEARDDAHPAFGRVSERAQVGGEGIAEARCDDGTAAGAAQKRRGEDESAIAAEGRVVERSDESPSRKGRRTSGSPPATPPTDKAQARIDDVIANMRLSLRVRRGEDVEQSHTYDCHTYSPNRLTMPQDLIVRNYLRRYCLAPRKLELKSNDPVILLLSLNERRLVGKPGTVVGFNPSSEVREDLEDQCTMLRASAHPDRHQGDIEETVKHLSSVEVVPSDAYPIVRFEGEREGTLILPEPFPQTVWGIGAVVRVQVPLLRAPLCRCLPRVPASLYHVHKDTWNKGRWFFCCSKPVGEQCGFFSWKTAKFTASSQFQWKAEID